MPVCGNKFAKGANDRIMDKFNKNSRVCFFGDSITSHGLYIRGIYEYYREKLNIPCEMYNCGVPGSTAKKGLDRIYDTVLSLNPTDVVVSFGINDVNYPLYDGREVTAEVKAQREKAIDDAEANIRKIADILSAEKINIIFCISVPYDELSVNKKEYNGVGTDAALCVLGERIKRMAAEYGGNIVDYRTPFMEVMKKLNSEGKTIHRDDRVHPSDVGQELITQIFLRAQGFDVELSTEYDELEKISQRTHSEWETKRYELETLANKADLIIYSMCSGIKDENIIRERALIEAKNESPYIAGCARAYLDEYDEIMKAKKELIAFTKKQF